ncbi:hypothetical protein [Tenacibaculum ovolyticum]|nr:hypothetical protein [Tenacibaculum ovolyticum]
MKIISQWIVENRLILKTKDEKYYYDQGRGHYSELPEQKAKQLIDNL